MRVFLSVLAVSLLASVEAVTITSSSATQTQAEGNFIDSSEACAMEGQNCACPTGSTIWYGHYGKWTSKTAEADITPCKNNIFGDSKPGTKKMCYCQPAPVLENWEDCECECQAKA